MSQIPVTIQDLVDAFARDIRQLTNPSTKEATVRLKYIDPLFRLLGWPVGDAGALADQEVVIEPSVDVVEGTRLRSRRPDYLFKIDFPRFTCEAKKPSVDLDSDRDAIFQAKRDAWNLQIPFTILTDFRQFRVYETTRTPVHAEPGVGSVHDLCFDFGDYPAQWDVIIATFGRGAVAGGSLEALRARLRRAPAGRRLRTVDRMLMDLRGDEPVNNVFLAFLEAHRKHLAAATYRANHREFPDATTPTASITRRVSSSTPSSGAWLLRSSRARRRCKCLV